MELVETIEFIQMKIKELLNDIGKTEESFLRMYGDSKKIHLAYAMGQREMLNRILDIQTNIMEEE